MKRGLWMVALIALLLMWAATAYAAREPVFRYWPNEDGTAKLIGVEDGAALPSTLKIPATIDGRPVKTLGRGLLAYCEKKNVRTVIIPEGIERIESGASYQGDVSSLGAFANLPNLRSVSLPTTLNQVGNYTFSGCDNLRSVTFRGDLDFLGRGVFVYCKRLKTVTFEGAVRRVGNYAFDRVKSLTTVNFKRGVKEIGRGAFTECVNLKKVSLDGCEVIEDYAFSDCTKLSNVRLPETLQSLGEVSFQWTKLKSLTIPKSLPVVPISAFSMIKTLKTVDARHVVSFERSAFSGAKNLREIVFGDQVENIGSAAFADCHSLTSVIIPATVKTMGTHSFSKCKKLARVTFEAGSTVAIELQAFEGCPKLREVVIPETITQIAPLAFYESSPTIVGHVGSYAEYYARTNNLTFRSIQAVQSIKLNKAAASVKLGKTIALKATVLPAGASYRDVSWSSSDEDVATVVRGKVTGISRGSAVVTATALDGSGIQVTCQVTVK